MEYIDFFNQNIVFNPLKRKGFLVFMEILKFIQEYNTIFIFIGTAVGGYFGLRNGIKSLKAEMILGNEQLKREIAVSNGEVKSEISIIKTKVENLCDHVNKQNGRIGKSEDWQQVHLEHFHYRKCPGND